MKLFSNEDIGISREKNCCSLEDTDDARSVAYLLDMQHLTFNFINDFKSHVICNFISAYQNGYTPNPCIDCNRYMKFEKLFLRVKQLNIDYMATGHYARIEKDENSKRYLLKKAFDDTKDQSYVLYSIPREQLKHILFPLGELSKTSVREIALQHGFVNAKKNDSQDICFVRDGNYAKFIEEYTGKTYKIGNFVDKDCNVLGQHKGIIRYTKGQRKGLGLSLSKPMYVHSMCIENNTVLLCEEKDLYSKRLIANNINLISCEKIEKPIRVKAKVRYNQKEQWATAEQIDDDKLHVEFDDTQRAITKGQAVVLYDDDIVVGGGRIMECF